MRHYESTAEAVRDFLDAVDESSILFDGGFEEKLGGLRELVNAIWRELWIAATTSDDDERRKMRWHASQETTDRLLPLIVTAKQWFREALKGEIDAANKADAPTPAA